MIKLDQANCKAAELLQGDVGPYTDVYGCSDGLIIVTWVVHGNGFFPCSQ